MMYMKRITSCGRTWGAQRSVNKGLHGHESRYMRTIMCPEAGCTLNDGRTCCANVIKCNERRLFCRIHPVDTPSEGCIIQECKGLEGR